ncbi:50S ribosomal protein L37ae [archaeon]|nr:50S ribosomal protein L37ae [archaeon]|tara:strand:- start:2220 stop:2435 length:216 start_codon:yes stop_codon:yes gene_type:complete
MARTKKIKSAGRFGPRYGRKIKERVIKIESTQKRWQKCPYCKANRVKREAIGIWQCKKCNKKFTGKAYTAV